MAVNKANSLEHKVMSKKKTATPLENEIRIARKKIVTDGYDMSVGEVMNLYRDQELTIDPVFQRLFRWDLTRKSRFIESLLLGIPIPPIFVYQDPNGVWELVDGLQRLSTILEFVGELRVSKSNDPEGSDEENDDLSDDEDGCDDDEDVVKYKKPSVLSGTKLLPSLEGKKWDIKERRDSIGLTNQIAIKRARIRIEILKAESDENAKFELFQRLNTGGSPLSEQEVRNCVAVMVNKKLFKWLVKASTFKSFTKTTAQTDHAMEKQTSVELVLRMIAFRHVTYDGRLDVHEYLDNALLQLARSTDVDWEDEAYVFTGTVHQFSRIFEEKSAGNRIGGTYFGPGPINRSLIQSLKSFPRLANVANRLVRVSNVPTPFSDRLQHPIFRSSTAVRRVCSA